MVIFATKLNLRMTTPSSIFKILLDLIGFKAGL